MSRSRWWKRGAVLVAAASAWAGVLPSGTARGEAAAPPEAILQDLRTFGQMGSVLLIAAHPDDENTQLITYLARGRGYRTAYLSLTRGDGGQNLLGPEFGDELGFLRTQELLAARRLDGGRQYFTRAIDFGFSKNAAETLRIWDRREVVSDVVRVIRTFRPDVVVLRFSPQNTNTHGHHTASAVVGEEAFKLAGDAEAFPEQVKTLGVWQPKRLLVNAGGAGSTLRMDVGGNDPVLGLSFGDIAGRSRAMHKTQGFGNFGGGGRGGSRMESFQVIGGAPAEGELMEGIDTSWGRVGPGGSEIARAVEQAIGQFRTGGPAATVPALLAIKRQIAALPKDRLVEEKHADLDRLIRACLGLSVETTVAQAEVVAGEPIQLRHQAVVTSSVPVNWVAVRYGATGEEVRIGKALTRGVAAVREESNAVPAGTPVSQPYWLREAPVRGLSRVAEPGWIGSPENPPVFPVEMVFEVGGELVRVADEPVQVMVGAPAEVRRRLEVVAEVALRFAVGTRLFGPGATKTVEVEATAMRGDLQGKVMLEVPEGWKATPPAQELSLKAAGERSVVRFEVTAPPGGGAADFGVKAQVGTKVIETGRKEMRYGHLPPLLLQPKARLRAVSVALATRGKRVGYVPGAGDSVAECLGEMGYEVKMLHADDLTGEGLTELDAVVIGVRALNARNDLAPRMEALFRYVEEGGTVIEQYHRPDGIKGTLAPYALRVGGGRITDEKAEVTFLQPGHRVLNSPNVLTAADFEGWVQERAIYLPNQWDKAFVPILAMHDPGEEPQEGALLIAPHGKGQFVYTGLVFFRELPAGVAGAYRLFANMVSLGKP